MKSLSSMYRWNALTLLGLTLLSTVSAPAQTVEKFTPVASGSNTYAFDLSLPVAEKVSTIGISADGKAIQPKAITFQPVDTGTYSCNILFLVDQSSGAGPQGTATDTRAFQSVLRQAVRQVAAANQKQGKTLYHVEIA